jgi:hypothetical protein
VSRLSLRLVLLVAASLAGLQSCSQQRKGAPHQDVLDTFSIDELKDFIRQRRNQTVYQGPAPLRTIPTPEIVDDIIQREKALYGPERRQELTELQDPVIATQVHSIAAMVQPANFSADSTGLVLIGPTLGARYRLCTGQSFAEQPVRAYCTAFVVGTDTMATAAHCLDEGWKSIRFVFGYQSVQDKDHLAYRLKIDPAEVFAPVEIVSKVKSGGADYAIVRVTPTLSGHPALKPSAQAVTVNEQVYTVGYPSGLPVKIAGQAVVRSVLSDYFVSNLDTFGGNSGSPVFNAATHDVVGMLVRGEADYVAGDVCSIAFICPESTVTRGCQGEDSTLIGAIVGALANQTATPPAELPKAAPTPTLPTITRQFDSGPHLSGIGADFSQEFTVTSDPSPDGYKVASFSLTLSGDRACNAWSTCRAAIEGNRVVGRFALQGHSEWFPPRPGVSEGHLVVIYAPR